MKKLNLLFSIMLAFVLSGYAQFTVTTVPPLNGGNGNAGVAFGLTSTQSILIDTIYCTFTGTGSTEIWVTTTDLTGPPNVTTTNGWTNLGTATIAAATTVGNVVPIPLSLAYTVLPGQGYRFYVNGAGSAGGAAVAYTTGTAGVSAPFTDGIVTIETGNLVGYGGAIPNPGFHPRQFNGSVKYSILGGVNDAAVLSVDSPTVYCAGMQNVYATVANFGANQIDSVEINWSVNGVAQTQVKYIGLLDTLNGAGSQSAQVLLGNAMFAAGSSAIQVYTSNPNGMMDTTNFNDTANVSVMSAAAPTSITLTNATLNSIDVNAVGGAGTIDYEYGPVGFATGTGTTGTSSTPSFTLSGLSQGTTYDVYVRSNCGAGDVSAYVGPQTFNTSYGVPFVQDFENWNSGVLNNPLPEGWSSSASTGPRWEAEDATGANKNSGNTGPLYDNTTPNTAGGMYVYLETSTGAGSDTIVSPPIYIDTNLSTVEVGFWYHMFGAQMGTLELFADTNGVRTLLTTLTGQQQVNQADGFIRYSTFLNGYQGKSVQLVFAGLRGTGFQSDMSIDDVTVDPVLPLNAGVIEVQSPSGNLCPGPVTPVVGVKNFGSNIIDSVNVVWDINGVLDSLMYVSTILPGDTASVSLASVNISSTTVYDISFYTNRPNNAADQFAADDTLKVQGLRTGLSGTVTLDPSLAASASNLTSFAQLEQVLNNYGVCGAVTVNVAAGTYNESLNISNAPGMSSVNTLTIDGGDSSTTTISHDNTNQYGTVTIAGTDYVTIKNMRIEATANNGAAILLNNASNNTFENNVLWANPSSLSTITNFVISGTTNSIGAFGVGNHNTLQNNLLVGGYYSIYMYGATANPNVGNVIHNNQIDSAYYYGSYIFYQDSLEYTSNVLDQTTRGQVNGDGVYLWYSNNYNISENYIHAHDYGMYFYNFFNANIPTQTRKSRITNNMVISESDFGIYMLYTDSVDFFNNSVATYGSFNPALQITTNTTNVIDNYDVRNNVLYSSSTEALEVTGTTDSIFTKLDNNVYYTGGSNLFNISGTTYADLASYQTGQPALNASSLDGDPQFLSSSDLHIIGAFINGAGDNSVPVTVDIDGDLRPLPGSTVVDPGADEFDPPLCPPSSNLGVTNVTLTSADIFWDGTAMDYQYEVVAGGAAQGTGTVVATLLDSVTVSGLTPSSSYDFYVREVCGRGDTSIWIGPFNFNTSNGVPYLEDFETFSANLNNGPFPRGWSTIGFANMPYWTSQTGTGNNANSFGTGPLWDHTNFAVSAGMYMFMETSGGTVGDSATLISPPVYVDTSSTAITIEYWYFNFGANIDRMEVIVDTNGVENVIATYIGQQQTVQTDPWLVGSHTIAGYAGKSIQVKFRGFNVNCCSGDIAIDDLRIFEPSPADASVTDILSPGSGCGLGATDSVTVEISNVGTAAIDSFPVVYTLNGGTPVVEIYLDTVQPGAVANYTFNTTVNLATAGTYDIVSYTNLSGDGDITNDTSDITINSIPIVGGFPYNEGFENGNGGWTTGGVTTFALGTPAGATINTAANGTQSWVTNLTGNYNNGEAGWVTGPCFDFSTLVNPVIELSVWWNAENSWDGAVMQSSIDGGATWQNVGAFGDPDNWYTDNSINGLATINNQEGWTGRNSSSNGSAGWVTAKNSMSNLAGIQGVILRVAFGSDGSVQDEGFAFDDIVIRESAAYDMALLDIVSPVSGAYLAGTSDSVRVTLANLGSDTATNFTVNYVLNGGAVVTETIAQMLPNDTMSYTFNTSVALPGPGQADTLDVYVAFSLDSVYTNDSIVGYIFDNDIKGLPFVDDFENSYTLGPVSLNQPGGWSAIRTGNPRWEIEDASGANENSLNTGPWYDRTTFGTSGGHYVYLETSGGAGNVDTLRSPSIVIPAASAPLDLSYSYHMYGATMGTLEVFIESNGAYTRVDSLSGQLTLAGDSAWTDTSIALTGAFNGQIVNIVFVGTSGTSFTSDMSIDDVSLDFAVGINKVVAELEGISVTPNPSNGLFNLTIETPTTENFNMSVRDAQGRTVYTKNLNVNGTYRDNLDFTSFAKGVYYMQIQTETESKVEKLIIQ